MQGGVLIRADRMNQNATGEICPVAFSMKAVLSLGRHRGVAAAQDPRDPVDYNIHDDNAGNT
jgi:hypothetical protein